MSNSVDNETVRPSEYKKKLNLFKLTIPTVFDMAETSLKNVTLSMISTSVT